MRIDVVTIFPDYLAPLSLSLVGKAVDAGIVDLAVHDLRWWTHDRHHTADDTPYGGGAGMVMKPEPWGEALDAMEHLNPASMTVVVPTPAGRVLDQDLAYELSTRERLVFACGRYEDYVLNGGEAAVLVITEAVVRLIPGVLGNPDSLVEESHAPGHRLLEYPNYTKPPVWRGRQVPPVLLSGNHAAIATWRREKALERTREHRPDLLEEGR